MKSVHFRISAWPAWSAGCALPAMTSWIGRCILVNRRSSRSASCSSRSGLLYDAKRRAKPSVNVFGSKRCLAPSTASGDAPDAASCRDSLSRVNSTKDLRASLRNCQSLTSETRRTSCSRVSIVLSQRSLPHAFVQSSSAAEESQLGMELLRAGLVREIKAKTGMEAWRRDEETGQAYSLKLTDAGLKAIAAD